MGRHRHGGRIVVLVGPDGAGKSTVADRLRTGLGPHFRGVSHHHWRPMLLPSPGALRGNAPRDVTKPHGAQPHPRVLSWILLAYYWVDFILGYGLRFLPARRRGDLVLIERGWFDMAVDARRYRLDVPPGLVRLLGRFLPSPDVRYVLDGSPGALHGRKAELPVVEIARQREAWRQIASRQPETTRLVDVDRPLADVVEAIREDVLADVDRPGEAPGRWVALPSRRRPRLHLPRGPRHAAVEGLRVYQPTARAARVTTSVASAAIRAGALHLLPSDDAMPRQLLARFADHVPPGGTYSLLNSNHPGRYVARILDRYGRPVAVAKVVDGSGDRAALAAEAAALATVAQRLHPPVRAPRVLAASECALVLESVTPLPRRHPWIMPEPVAAALGALFATGPSAPSSGPAQGDCAPWNLLQVADGWVLIDWEHSREDGSPFADVLHFMTQGYALVGRPDRGELVQGVLHGRGWIGRSIRAYAESAGLSTSLAPDSLRHYLSTPNPILDGPTSRHDRPGQAARVALRDALS